MDTDDDLIAALVADSSKRRLAPALVPGLAGILGAVSAGALLQATAGCRPPKGGHKFPASVQVRVRPCCRLDFRSLGEGRPQSGIFGVQLVTKVACGAAACGNRVGGSVRRPSDECEHAAGLASECPNLCPHDRAFGDCALASAHFRPEQGRAGASSFRRFLRRNSGGGISTAFYAAACPVDSAALVAGWYMAGILLLGLFGSYVGRRCLHW